MNGESSTPYAGFAVVVNDDRTQLNVLSGLVRLAGLDSRVFATAEAALADMSAHAEAGSGGDAALPAGWCSTHTLLNCTVSERNSKAALYRVRTARVT